MFRKTDVICLAESENPEQDIDDGAWGCGAPDERIFSRLRGGRDFGNKEQDEVPAKERLWKALLLSFGDRVTVVGPEEYKKELILTAKKFLSNYDT